MPWRSAYSGVLQEFYQSPLPLHLHTIVIASLVATAVRGEPLGIPTLLLHCTAVGLRAKAPASKTATGLVVLCAWFWRLLVYLRWAYFGAPMSSLAYKAYQTGFGLVGFSLTSTTEMLYILQLLPGVAGAVLLAAQIQVFCRALESKGLAVSVPCITCLAATNMLLPHLVMFLLQQSANAAAARQRKVELEAHEGGPAQGEACRQGKRHVEAPASSGPEQEKQQQHGELCAAVPEGQGASKSPKAQVSTGGAARASSSSPPPTPQSQEPWKVLRVGSTPHSSSSTAGTTGELTSVKESAAHTSCAPGASLEGPIFKGASGNWQERQTFAAALTTEQATAGAEDCSMQARVPEPLGPRPSALATLHKQFQLVHRASQRRHAYRSRLVQPQIICKLMDHEPHQLAPGIIHQTNAVLQASGYGSLSVATACVRNGCALLIFDVFGPCSRRQSLGSDPAHLSRLQQGRPLLASKAPAAEPSVAGTAGSHSLVLDAETVQGWLQALLAPGVRVREGAVAHIAVGGHQLRAAWQQHSWTVEEAPRAGRPPLKLALLYVDSPVSRLPARPASRAHHHHSICLLLHLDHPHPAAALSFIGSDGVSAGTGPSAAEHNEQEGAGLVIQCVVRGPWGACLPVAVAGWEVSNEEAQPQEEEGEGQGSGRKDSESTTTTCVLALTLDVDLATAPGPGAVQLELWAGLNILASAPLLLLPPLPDASPGTDDPLLQELQEQCDKYSWEPPADGSTPGTSSSRATPQQSTEPDASEPEMFGKAGSAALLSDLGQVLHTADCVARSCSTAGKQQLGEKENYVFGSEEGRGDWGGVMASVATQRAWDPCVLANTLSLAEGLLEYSRSEGLVRTGALVSSASEVICQRHKEVQGGGGDRAGQPAPSSSLLAQQKTPVQQQVLQAKQQDPPTLKTSLHAVFHGFRTPGLEDAYAARNARSCTRLMNTWRPIYLLWLVVCLVKSIRTGDPDAWRHLPMHILCAIPNSIGIILGLRRQYQWQEAVVVSQAGVRALVCLLSVLGVLAYPASYLSGYRLKVDLYVEMRLPSLLATQGLLLAANLLRFYCISRYTGWVWLWRTLSQRLLVTLIGLAMDLRRRHAFLWECSHGVAPSGSATKGVVMTAGKPGTCDAGPSKVKVL